MKPSSVSPWLCLLAASGIAHAAPDYPAARKVDVSDDYHGTKVEDPYRWLEDDNAKDTKAWATAENKVTQAFLGAIPQRETIRKRLKSLWNYPRIGLPFEAGGKWFTYRNTGLQNMSVLYVADSPEGEGHVLLDPNTLSKDSSVAVQDESASEDGKLLGYAVSTSGSDWQEIRVRSVVTGKDLPDVLKWVKFSGISWLKDGSGFYYSRYDAPKKKGASLTEKNEFQKLCFHKLGTKQSADPVVYERKDHANWYISGGVTEDGRYLIIGTNEGTDTKNLIFYKDLSQPASPVVELLGKTEADYDFIDNDGPVFYFRTDLDAPRGRVIAIDTGTPEKAKREIIPQAKDALEGARAVGGQIICSYLQDAKSAVKYYDMAGKLIRDVALAGIGTAGEFGGRKKDKQAFFTFGGYTQPTTVFRLDLASGDCHPLRKSKIAFDGDAYETRQIFYTSKDGTKIPMFITSKKGLKLDGNNPTLLYAYGGFAINETPYFAIPRAVWMEMGGVLAVANIRGGGEYGKEWHESSFKTLKQNGFDDFIAGAEWLIANKYTSTPKLAIQGGSNGGLLIGAVMTQRPELFAAALPQVGVMDMLRFHKFTVGAGWIPEYGSSDDADQFKSLFAFSPYHNLKPGTRYPATMVTTADHDDRVVPAHSFKFAARLQEYQPKDGPPVLIRIQSSGGHSGGSALSQQIDEATDEWAFLVKALGM